MCCHDSLSLSLSLMFLAGWNADQSLIPFHLYFIGCSVGELKLLMKTRVIRWEVPHYLVLTLLRHLGGGNITFSMLPLEISRLHV
jgi:hypothetical protein